MPTIDRTQHSSSYSHYGVRGTQTLKLDHGNFQSEEGTVAGMGGGCIQGPLSPSSSDREKLMRASLHAHGALGPLGANWPGC